MLIARANIATPTQGSTITVLTFYIRLQLKRVLLYIYIYIHIKQNILESTQFNITQLAVKFFDRRQHESGQNEFRAAVYCPIYVAGATVYCPFCTTGFQLTDQQHPDFSRTCQIVHRRSQRQSIMSPVELQCSVPQGSVLCPIQFIAYGGRSIPI